MRFRWRDGAILLLSWIAASAVTFWVGETMSSRSLDFGMFESDCRARGGLVTDLDLGVFGPSEGVCRSPFDWRLIGVQDGDALVPEDSDPA